MADARESAGFRARLRPAAGVALIDSGRRILLLQHRHDHRWGTPGGGMEPHETPVQAACREVLEETGLSVHHAHLIDAFGGPEFEVTYPGTGSVHYVVILYGSTHWTGDPTLQVDEVVASGWFTQDQTHAIDLAPDMRVMLPHAFAWYDDSRP